jgi:inner membrane protein
LDTFTHALSGALVARAAAPAQKGAAARTASPTPADCVALGFLAAAFPDSDVAFSYFSPLAYLYLHRGITHSVVLLPLWAAAIAWIWSRLRRKPEAFRSYLLVAFLAIGIHIAGDLITSFGTMVLAPFSDARFAWDTTFIIDLWLTGLLLGGLLACALFRRSRLPALLGLAAVTGYVGFQAWLQQSAQELGYAYARAQGIAHARIEALPRPVSPFNWMVIVATPERYHYSFVNLRRTQPRVVGPDAGFIAKLDAPHLPIARMQWQSAPRLGEGEARAMVEEAWRHPDFAFFRWFAAYPVLSDVERSARTVCVWFQDLRFLSPGRDRWPFRYGMCREDGGPWRAFEAKPGAPPIPMRS